MKINNKLKKYLYLILFILLISVVNAQELICLNPIQYNITCQVVTPVISCSLYTYELYNDNSTLIDSGLMNVFINGTYFFNFTQDIGRYYVKICDDSTRQLIVEGDNMIGLTGQTWLLLTLILMFILFIWLSFKFDPLMMLLDGIIMIYFGYYSYTIYASFFITLILVMIGLMFMIIGVMAKIGQSRGY